MKTYLAIPYSFNPFLSCKIADEVADKLMQEGHIVFSPISHSHGIANYLPALVRTDSDWWMTQDLPFVEWCDEVHVVVIGEKGLELIIASKGVQAELAHAAKFGKTIKYLSWHE